MTREERLAAVAEVFDAWVDRHAGEPDFNADNPTAEQEAELAQATYAALGAEIIGTKWANYVDNLSDAERELLLQSPAYQDVEL